MENISSAERNNVCIECSKLEANATLLMHQRASTRDTLEEQLYRTLLYKAVFDLERHVNRHTGTRDTPIRV